MRLLLLGTPPLLRLGLVAMLDAHADQVTVTSQAEERPPQVVLVGCAAHQPVEPTVSRALAHGAPVVLLLGCDDLTSARQGLSAGATDWLWHSAEAEDIVTSCVRAGRRFGHLAAAREGAHQVVSSGAGLSGRETDVLRLITLGRSNTEIADELFLSINSVKTYVRTAYRKIKVNRRTQAVRWSLTHGLGGPAGSSSGAHGLGVGHLSPAPASRLASGHR